MAELDPPHTTGRTRSDQRSALVALIFHVRTGCQWNQLPRDFPDENSVYRTFQRWIARGVFDRIWAVRIQACIELPCSVPPMPGPR